MPRIGELKTEKPIEVAIREIKDWLSKINVNGLDIDLRYDAKTNIALLRFKYKDKAYEFRSTKQKNCRLNMFGIARVMEFKVRAHLMGIEGFGSSMKAYEQLEGRTEPKSQAPINELSYVKLGISPLASNAEIEKRYKQLMKTFHPDMALSIEAKREFERRASEINQAYTEVKKERGIN